MAEKESSPELHSRNNGRELFWVQTKAAHSVVSCIGPFWDVIRWFQCVESTVFSTDILFKFDST